jgi:hypothetical protein
VVYDERAPPWHDLDQALVCEYLTDSPGLLDVIHQYGASWQIVHDAEIGVWTAVNRPTPTALHFICAHNLASLAVKLAATGDRGTG